MPEQPRIGIPLPSLQQSIDILCGAETPFDISRPAGDIYAYLADFTRHTEWAHTYLAVEALGPDSTRVGSRFRVREKQDLRWDKLAYTTIADREGPEYTTEIEVTALDPDERIAWRSKSPGGPFGPRLGSFTGQWEFVLVPVSEAVATLRMRARLSGPERAIKKVIEDLQARGYPLDILARQVDRAMHNIRTILEGRAQPPGGWEVKPLDGHPLLEPPRIEWGIHTRVVRRES